MTTALILSDTHGNRRAIDKIGGVLRECGVVFHLGDTSEDGAYIRANYNKNAVLVNGNCDGRKLGEDEVVTEIDGVKIFATHGHLYGAKYSLLKLAARAKELGCAYALYGHTHAAREDEIDGVTLVNPGAMTRYGKNSYCYLVVNGGKAVCKIVEVI